MAPAADAFDVGSPAHYILRGLYGAVILGAGKIIVLRPKSRGVTDEAEYLGRLRSAVADVVARQRDTGIDLVNDGEFGHSMGMKA
jgi:hypothetical protein